MPLPVFTESAEILMSSTAEVTSVDGKVSVASQSLNLPSMATEAFTKNFTSLSSGVMVKTGPCAWANDGNSAEAKRQQSIIALNPSSKQEPLRNDSVHCALAPAAARDSYTKQDAILSKNEAAIRPF